MFRSGHLFFLLMILTVGVASATLQVDVQPREVFVGETAWYSVTSNLGVPAQVTLPDVKGLTWLPGGGRTNQRSYTVNGKTSFQGSVSYAFRCDKEGTFLIPGVKAVENGKRVTGPPLEVVAKKRRFTASGGKTVTLDDLMSLHATFPGLTGKKVFLGQEIPVRITFAVAQQLEPQFSYPRLDAGDAVIKDFSNVNSDSAQFATGEVRSRIKDGIRFSEATFTSALTPLATGKLGIKGEASVTIYPDGRRRGYLEDFMGVRQGGQQRKVSIPFPDIEVVSPPPLPADAGQYLGLVGQWTVDFSLSSDKTKVGEPVTASLTVKGTGGNSGFTVPQLVMAHCRIYEPEVKKNPDTGDITVSWAVIPLSQQAGDISLSVCTLDPTNGGKYITHSFVKKLAVSPGDTPTGAGSVFTPETTSGEVPAEKKTQSSLLYIKNQPGTVVEVPLVRNHGVIRIVLTSFGLVFFAACLVVRRFRPGSVDESLARRQRATRHRGDVIRRLEKARTDEERLAARSDVVQWLVDMWGCPPGTSASELADIAVEKAPDIVDDLRALDHGEFAPENALKKADISRLAAGLRVVKSLILLVTLSALQQSARADQTTDFKAGVAAYDAGKYDQAETIFSHLGRVDAEDPVLLYNRANCLFETGKPALALALYGRALKLSPRDSDIRENLNYVRSSLGLPVRGSARNPMELLGDLRDSLRPDEWLLIASLALCVGGLMGGVMILKNRAGVRVFAASVVAALGLYGVTLRQQATSYRVNSHAVIISRQAVAWRHPSTAAKKADFVPVYGENVEIVARRTGWVLVKNDESESWMRASDLHLVW